MLYRQNVDTGRTFRTRSVHVVKSHCIQQRGPEATCLTTDMDWTADSNKDMDLLAELGQSFDGRTDTGLELNSLDH